MRERKIQQELIKSTIRAMSKTATSQPKISASTKIQSAQAENEQLKCILLALVWFVSGLALGTLVAGLFLLSVASAGLLPTGITDLIKTP